MKDLRLSADSTSEEVAPFALAVHSLAGLPVTMRSLNKKRCSNRKRRSVRLRLYRTNSRESS